MLLNPLNKIRKFVAPLTVPNPKNKFDSQIPLDPKQLFFFDIETVAAVPNISDMSEEMQICWFENAIKWNYDRKDEKEDLEDWLDRNNNKTASDYLKSDEFYLKRAGLYPEYGKIICISFGCWSFEKNDWFIGTIALGDNFKTEEEILENLFCYLEACNDKIQKNLGIPMYICGHCISTFDIPYVIRRSFINGVNPSPLLYKVGDKDWNQRMIDTINVWRGGSKNGDNTLKTITTVLGLPSPKDDLTGKEMTSFYYDEGFDMDRVITYCEKDVKALIDIILNIQTEKSLI